ncbi:putative gustatory receptor 59d [Drosophila elegans]|uniref:putative gustatory receptor 59d n=1 Tax=Drosophila elegans TaxID=30023 RepID=UPI001BC853E5|nr:putative gustatory receptor 59d [Drosophila elegans]
MVNLVRKCLIVSYFYGRISGVLNFEIDIKTGRTLVTKRATICAAGLHLFIFITPIYHLIHTHGLPSVWNSLNSLQAYFFVVASGLRMICVFLALVSRWSQGRTFLRLFNSFRRLYQNNPDIIKLCRRSIVSKCFFVLLSDALNAIFVLLLMQYQLTISWTLLICVIFSSLRGRYILLNKNLQAIIVEAQSLIANRGGAFKTRCCCLADRLEEIARNQSELQELIDVFSRAYQCQVFEAFTLNLARNPLKLRSLGLFKMDRESFYASGKFLLTYSLMLTQYDIEHF